MDSRQALLAVLATAFADGIPAIERRVGLMRIAPVWGEEELPIILLDFDSERREVETAAPRIYKHSLSLDVLIYCKGRSDAARLQLLDLMRQTESILAEWQFILRGDVQPDAADVSEMLIDSLAAGDSINYFHSPDGDMDHVAARIGCVAEFRTSGCAQGEERLGAPTRNIIAEFDCMYLGWRLPGANDVLADEVELD
jgi:hypothetical protein